MVDVYEIVRGIHQAAANAFDGSLTDGHHKLKEYGEEFERVLAGLKREEGDPVLDKRVIDGFKVATQGNYMKLSYQGEVELKEVHGENFEDDIVELIENIVKFLKKEYKTITKETLSLEQVEEPHVVVRHLNRHRTWVEAVCVYKIGGIDPQNQKGEAEEKLAKSFKKWIDQQKK